MVLVLTPRTGEACLAPTPNALRFTLYVLRMASNQLFPGFGLELPGFLEYLFCVFQGRLGDGQAAYHGGYLLLLGGGVQLLHVGARAVAGDLLGDLEMAVGEGRDLGQV